MLSSGHDAGPAIIRAQGMQRARAYVLSAHTGQAAGRPCLQPPDRHCGCTFPALIFRALNVGIKAQVLSPLAFGRTGRGFGPRAAIIEAPDNDLMGAPILGGCIRLFRFPAKTQLQGRRHKQDDEDRQQKDKNDPTHRGLSPIQRIPFETGGGP